MIKTNQILSEEMRGYACPKDRISRLVKKGELFPIVKGLYETEHETPTTNSIFCKYQTLAKTQSRN
jgi:hypothetical protein